MKSYGIQRGNPVILSSVNQIFVANAILDAADKYQVAVATLNILPDHMHLIVAADSEPDISEIMRKLKGYSAHKFRTMRRNLADSKLWAQKFNRRPLRDENVLANAMHYVHFNHLKHAPQWGAGLIQTWEQSIRAIVEARCTPVQRISEGLRARG